MTLLSKDQNQIFWPSQKTSTYLIPEVPACGWLEKVPPAEPEVPGRAAEAPKSGALSLVSESLSEELLRPVPRSNTLFLHWGQILLCLTNQESMHLECKVIY